MPKPKARAQAKSQSQIKDSWPYPNQDQDAKPQSETFITNQNPKSGLKGHGCPLLLQNQDREPKFGL